MTNTPENRPAQARTDAHGDPRRRFRRRHPHGYDANTLGGATVNKRAALDRFRSVLMVLRAAELVPDEHAKADPGFAGGYVTCPWHRPRLEDHGPTVAELYVPAPENAWEGEFYCPHPKCRHRDMSHVTAWAAAFAQSAARSGR